MHGMAHTGERNGPSTERSASATAGTYGILHLIDSLEPGGAEQVVYALATGTDRARYRVSVCTLQESGDEVIARRLAIRGYRCVSLDRRPGFDRAIPGKIRRIINEDLIDIIHCHVGGEFYGHLGALGTRARVVTTIHGIFPSSLTKDAFIGLVNLFKKNVKVAVSREVKDRYRCRHLIYNGVDVPSQAETPAPDGTMRADRPDGVNVAIIGRLSEVKNHRNFLNAARIVSREHPRIRFFVVGSGPLECELKQHASNLGIAEQTIFTGFREDIGTVLASIDMVVLSSDSEGLPMVVIESMAAGRPVVATNVGGIPEVVVDGITGVLVPPRNPQKLADAIGRLAEDESLRLRMGIAARSRVEKHFSTARMITGYEKLYEELVEERSNG